MRILVTGRAFLSRRGETELGIFELDQARALLSAGHDVRLAALDTRSFRRLRPWGMWDRAEGALPVTVASVPASGLPEGVKDALEAQTARRIWRRLDNQGWTPELVHGHFGAAFGPAAEEHGVPFVYTEHFSGMNRPELPPRTVAAAQKRYGYARRLICVSSALGENIRKTTGFEAQVVPNIVDTGLFAPRRVPHQGFRFVTTGNLVPIKNMRSLLEAFAALGEGTTLTVFGDGPERQALETLAKEKGAAGRVEFRGAVSRQKLEEAYRTSDCFVLASRSETFGLAWAEALSSGLPVIATRCGGPEDFVNGENGLLVPVDDVPALSRAMEAMCASIHKYDSDAISQEIRRQFSSSAVADALGRIYASLL